jgi:hypothetical protein
MPQRFGSISNVNMYFIIKQLLHMISHGKVPCLSFNNQNLIVASLLFLKKYIVCRSVE